MKTVRMCNMPPDIAAKVFEMLNAGQVKTRRNELRVFQIETDVEPIELIYPEGWYYAKGRFRNKHTSTTGAYIEINMVKSNGEKWDVPYCTLDN